MEELQTFGQKAITMLMEFAPKLALAIIVWIVGFKIIKYLVSILKKMLEKANFDNEIKPFLTSLADISLKVLLLFSIAGIIGIETASFVAVLAAAGFAVGLALQGSLGNFAAGIVILIFRPYKIGDWVSIQDKFGKVEEIQIFNTMIVTPGMKTLIIPNGQVIEDVVTNYSAKDKIRLELVVSMPYEESFSKIRDIILEVLQGIPEVLPDDNPEIGILAFDSHNIQVAVRPFIHPDNYWEATFEVYRKIKSAFSEHKIKMAYSEGVELGPIGE